MSLNKKLRMLADVLPETPQIRNGHIVSINVNTKGEWILAKDKDAKDKEGNPIKPSTWYAVKQIQYQNHRKNIMRAYKNGGEQAVEDYVAKIRAFEQATKQTQ